MKYLQLLVAMAFFASCQSHSASTGGGSLQLNLQPLIGTDTTLVNAVVLELQETGYPVTLAPPIPLPHTAYYSPRNRYRADSLVDFLHRATPNNIVTIGLTEKDISITKGSVVDWGIMGLGLCPGNACIVSTFRLTNTNLQNQLYKLVLHELGHTQGLQHCANAGCLMRDAEGGNPLNDEKTFCTACAGYLEKRGWRLAALK